MKIYLIIWFAINLNFFQIKILSQTQLAEHQNNFFSSAILTCLSENDLTRQANLQKNLDTTQIIKSPTFFTNSNLFLGAEILNPLKPKDFFTRATRLWRTDIRLGISQGIGDDITTIFSIRADDSPQTNSIKLYETFIKINHRWGALFFGQRRVQTGNNSYYLNNAFDRTFWDKGLIYNFLMRGIESMLSFSNSKLNLFIGSELSAGFIGGGKYFIQPFNWLTAQTSVLYIARDPQYAAFGTQFGLELKESTEKFEAYEVIGYKVFDQEPTPIKELTLFTEGCYQLFSNLNLGCAVLFRRLIIKPYQDELRTSIDFQFKVSNNFTSTFQTEVFNIADFSEVHLGIAGTFQYYNIVKITPRIRYIITEFGPNIGFIGIEGQIVFGNGE